MNGNLSSLLICVHEKRKIPSRWFLCSSSYFLCTSTADFLSFSAKNPTRQQARCQSAESGVFSMDAMKNERFSRKRFSSIGEICHEKRSTRAGSMCVCVSGKCVHFNGNLCFPRGNCLKMALELVGGAWTRRASRLATNTSTQNLSSN